MPGDDTRRAQLYGRALRLCVRTVAEERTGAARVGDVALALEQRERFLCRSDGLLFTSAGSEHRGEREQRLSMPHEVLGGLERGHSFPRETLRLLELSSRGEDHRVGASLEADGFVVVRRGVGVGGEDLDRFVVASELVQRSREVSGDAGGEPGAGAL